MGNNIFVLRDWFGNLRHRFTYGGIRPNSFLESSHTVVTPKGFRTITRKEMQTNQDVFDHLTNQWCVLTSHSIWDHDHQAYLLQGYSVHDGYGNILA